LRYKGEDKTICLLSAEIEVLTSRLSLNELLDKTGITDNTIILFTSERVPDPGAMD
jgi:hypothetical protein